MLHTRFVQRVKNTSEIKYVGVGETSPSESEAGGNTSLGV